jgi:uncharacterized protein (DUF302 family)
MTLIPTRGMVHLRSPHSVVETMARLEAGVVSRGITVHARINHSGDAKRAGFSMNPTILLIFGNALAGTPLMVASPGLAIDLPLKALAWQDADGVVWLSYNSLEYLQERHAISKELIQNLAGIRSLCETVVES